MKKFSVLCLLLMATFLKAQHTIDLAGRWMFQIDHTNCGIEEKWFEKSLDDVIQLPGSMPERLKGDLVTIDTKWTGSLYDSSFYHNPRMERFRKDDNIKFPFFLTPDRHYVGVAWYAKDVVVPKDWKEKRIVLFLERPHIETTLWVDGKKVGMQNSLVVPHEYDLTTLLNPGKHRLVIRIDNTIKDPNVGIDSHSVTDQTQGNWNGIVGRMELVGDVKSYFDNLQVFPQVKAEQAVVKMKLFAESAGKGAVSLGAELFNSDNQQTIPMVKQEFALSQGENEVEMTLPMKDALLWDEFTPALYRLSATFEIGKSVCQKEVEFGMKEFTIEGKWFYINNRKVMLRGTVENCCFPLTGYAPMEMDEWIRVFQIARSYGLNHMRFHSFCPPEAAFKAADRVGFYLQPEGPSWPNHGSSLGNGKPIDRYLLEETVRLNKAYGNYASYCMLACGNEPAGRWVAWASNFVKYWRATDSRRVYTGASVGGSWAWQPVNEFHVKAGARGLDWTANKAPETMSDFRARIDSVKQPYVSHETGQWCAFPNFDEIRKYTGVNKAKNFEIFKELLADGDMADRGHDFMMASGKLQALCYKYEIEKTLRTPDYAGFQLLSLNDYSGQGTALVGVLDVFWEEKGYIDATAFRRFCAPTVVLARIPKFTYTNKESFKASIEIAHFGASRIEGAIFEATLREENGAIVARKTVGRKNVEIGNCLTIGEVEFPLNAIEKAKKMNLEVSIKGTDVVNDWDFWVYPENVSADEGEVYVCDTLDTKAIEQLNKGGRVLLLAGERVSYGKEVAQQFTPVFWNTSWFKMRPPHTTGIFVNEYHPVFSLFPTEYHSNLQWWELLSKSRVIQFDQFPEDFQPIVQSIDTWFISRKIGVLFEANVSKGKLMMTTLDLKSEPEKRLVARQLYASVLHYMNSDKFRPKYGVSIEAIADLFTNKAQRIDMFTKDAPDELKVKTKR